jgi:hypothetical protein
LPWERRADPGSPETPWLALLLFYEEEAPAPEVVSLKELNKPGAKFPPFVKERGQNDDDKVTVIHVRQKMLEGMLPRIDKKYVITDQTLAVMTEAIPKDILSKLASLKGQTFIGVDAFLAALKNAIGAPQTDEYKDAITLHAAELKDELAILTHVREAADYIITDQSLAALKTEGVPGDVLLKLASLKEQEFIGAEAFLNALKNVISDEQASRHQEAIARHAADRIELAVVIGNRLPKPKGISTVHLVSVEGRYNASGFDYQGAGENDLIRLVSLQSWSFACVDHQRSFTGLLTGLDRNPSTLRLPDSHSDGGPDSDTNAGVKEVKDFLASGALPLWHGLRQGGKTVSWYHGPLATAENRLRESDASAPDLPVRAADELIRYNPTTGMFDVSYGAAWELGRLLALQSKNFSVSLYNWKRAHAQQLRQAEEELLHASPLDDGPEQKPVPIPPEISDWFRRLSLLEGVPFNYLVPDERLLPLESIRFFQMDWLWIECLLDGAFSIGRVIAADHQRDAEHTKSPAANPHAKISGVLMRSEVVAGWPGLLVDGFNGGTKLNLLRMDRLSANVLLCLFDGEATAVDFHLRPETLHFGLAKLDSILWRTAPAGTLDVLALAKAIQGNLSSFTSAQFARRMIEISDKVRFQLGPPIAGPVPVGNG